MPNLAPLVDAGADQVVVLPREALLQGSASDDGAPAGAVLVITWSVVDGPGAVTFEDSSAVQTSASFEAAGVYTLRLSADDGLLVGSDDTIVEVLQNQAPVVEAGPDATLKLPDAASLTGSVVDDGLPDDILTTAWSKVSGPGEVTFADASSPETTADFSQAGEYTLRLTGDDGTLQAQDDVIITVQDPPESSASGCSCRTGRSAAASGWVLIALLLCFLARIRANAS
jgi:MYXO-CTERM domain-containing protein